MTLEHLAARLAEIQPELADPTPDCPDEHTIAGYVDGRLDAAASGQLERHLADCGHCLGLVALLSGEHETGAVVRSSPEDTPSPAAIRPARQWRWHAVQKWAVAAALVLAVPILYQTGRNADPVIEDQAGDPSTTTRMAAPAGRGLRLLAPGAGAAVNPSRLLFSWTEVSGSPYYDLRILTDEGDVVVEQRVPGTSWRPPAALGLEPGAEYFVLVEAFPSGDKPVSSRHVPFRIAE